jgi:hypothetical protein
MLEVAMRHPIPATPIPIDTSAAVRLGASLTPSPTIATFFPAARQPEHSRYATGRAHPDVKQSAGTWAHVIRLIEAHRNYACCRQRPMIHAYAVIIAATLNTIRYSMSYVISWSVMKSKAPLSVEQCARHSLDTDGPSGRNCNQRRRHRSRGVGAWQASRFATAAWVVWLRRVTTDLFSSVLLSGCRVGPSC